MYTSDDNAQTFKQVSTLLAQVPMPLLSCAGRDLGVCGGFEQSINQDRESNPVLFWG